MSVHPPVQLFERAQSERPLSRTEYCLLLLHHVGEVCAKDQDSLLVKRQSLTNSPVPVIRELVPSSHQRNELSNTILCIFSRLDQRIREGIPIHDSQSSRKRLIRHIFTPTFHVVRLKKSFRRFFRTPVFSISMCIIIVNFSLCSDQRRRLGVKISYCQQIKKITEALRLSAWCLSENGRRGVHVASACRNSQSEARI